MTDRYAKDGVDIGAEQRFVNAFRSSVGGEKLPGIYAAYLHLGDFAYGFSTDGVGGKLLSYLLKGDLSDSSYDLAAMLKNDLAAEFIRPLVALDYIAVNKMVEEHGKQMGKGWGNVLNKLDMYDGGGESATLIDQIKEDALDWAGFVWGLENRARHEEWIKKRKEMCSGLRIVGFMGFDPEREGFTYQSNGSTTLRKLENTIPLNEKVTNRTLLDELTAPSIICSDIMVEIRDNDSAHLFVPVTGGGYTNIIRALPDDIRAEIEFKRDGNTIFDVAQREFNISEEEIYRTFNVEHVVLVGTEKPGMVIDTIQNHGFKAREIGELKERGDNPPLTVNGQDYSKY